MINIDIVNINNNNNKVRCQHPERVVTAADVVVMERPRS